MALSKRRILGLIFVSLLIFIGAASLVDVPGYTDADYYFAISRQLSAGRGFQQPFIWNYLAKPSALPQPAHLYWMPLTSMLASLPLALVGGGYRSSQFIFVLLAALLPLLTLYVSGRLGADERQQTIAVFLALFPGYYLPFFVTTDAFVLFALLAMGGLLLLARMSQTNNAGLALAAGILVGFSHLTRADGLLLLVPAAWALWRSGKRRVVLGVAFLIGYLIVMGPWMARMIQVSGTPLSPGASKTLWLRNYDELFSYPADFLSSGYLLAAGVGRIIVDRLRALVANLVSTLAVNHLIFLLPFSLLAAWRMRQRRLIQLAGLYWATLLLVMSFIFPFPGSRGGYFHSSTALMPIIWALAPLGLDEVVRAVGSRRDWGLGQAKQVFGVGMVAIAAAVTVFLGWQRLIPSRNSFSWNASARNYRLVGERLDSLANGQVGLVAVNNPPGYWNATGQAAVVIPNGGRRELLNVVQDFDVEWVVLEANHPAGLAHYYLHPEALPGLKFVESLTPPSAPAVHIYQIEGDSG